MLNNISCIVFTYLITGLVSILILTKFFKSLKIGEAILIGLITGPVLVSFTLSVFFVFFPGQSDGFYRNTIVAIFILLLLLFFKQIYLLMAWLKKELKYCLKLLPRTIWFWLFVIAFLCHVFYQAIALPIVGHDGIVYAITGKSLYSEKTLSNYPVINQNIDLVNNFNIRHLPGMPSLYSWFYIFIEDSNSDILLRTVSPIYGFYLILMLYLLIRLRSGIFAAMIGVAIYITTPFFSFQAIGNTIDPLRITLFLTVFFTMFKLLAKETRTNIFLMILLLFMSIYVHSGNLLLIPVLALVYLFISKNTSGKIAVIFFLTILFLLLFFAAEHLDFNFEKYLVEEGNYRKVNALGYEWFERVKSGTASRFEVIWTERFQCLSRFSLFGIISYLGLAGIIWWVIKGEKRKLDKILLIGMASWGLIVIMQFYINYRYISTVCPVLAYFAAICIGSLFINFKKRQRVLALVMFTVLNLTAFAFFTFCFISGMINLARIASGNNYRLSNTSSLLNKYIEWKIYAHPMDFITIRLSPLVNEKAKALFYGMTTVQPSHCYYLKNGTYFLARKAKDAVKILNRMEFKYLVLPSEYEKTNGYKKSVFYRYLTDEKLSRMIFKGREYDAYVLFERLVSNDYRVILEASKSVANKQSILLISSIERRNIEFKIPDGIELMHFFSLSFPKAYLEGFESEFQLWQYFSKNNIGAIVLEDYCVRDNRFTNSKLRRFISDKFNVKNIYDEDGFKIYKINEEYILPSEFIKSIYDVSRKLSAGRKILLVDNLKEDKEYLKYFYKQCSIMSFYYSDFPMSKIKEAKDARDAIKIFRQYDITIIAINSIYEREKSYANTKLAEIFANEKFFNLISHDDDFKIYAIKNIK